MADSAKLIKKWIAAFNRHDADEFASFYADNAVVDDPVYPKPLRGKAEIARDMREFCRAFPDVKARVLPALADRDSLAFEAELTGTHTGELIGPAGEKFPATHRSLRMRVGVFAQVDSKGLLTTEHRYYNVGDMMTQLGLGVAGAAE